MKLMHSCSSLVRSRLGKAVVAPLLAVLLLSALQLRAQTSGLEPSAGDLNFLVISDWGGKGGATQLAVAQQLGRAAASHHTRFVITCGDNYHGSGISSPDSPRWKTDYEAIYNNPSLSIPWYPSLGNHDNRGNAEAEIQYSTRSSRWKMPARYYAHTEKFDGTNDALFVHLDTSPFVTAYRKPGSSYHVLDQDPNIQLRWLESVLADSSAPCKIVVGHHPIYAAAPTHGDTKELIKTILPLLQKYRVQFYLCGHDHVLQHLVHGPLNFFVCGGGSSHRAVSQRPDALFGADSLGFLSMTLTPTAVAATFIDDKGKKLYSATIPLSRTVATH